MTRRSTGPMGSWPPTTACLVDPARALKPKDKPRVERPMPYVRDSMWRGRELARTRPTCRPGRCSWCCEVAGVRHHRSLDGAVPAVGVRRGRGAGADRRCRPQRFELAGWIDAQGRPGLPHQGRQGVVLGAVASTSADRVDAREGDRTVEVFVDGEVIKTWARIDKGTQTDWADYPPEKVAFFMRTPVWCRKPGGRARRPSVSGDRGRSARRSTPCTGCARRKA